MTEVIGVVLLNVGVVVGIWGFVWRMCNRFATGAMVMLCIGLVCLVAGGIITGELP